MSNERFHIYPAVYLVVTKDNKVLLQRRFNTGWADGQYDVLSGHVEAGEIPTEAVVREAREEGNLIVMKKDLIFLQSVYREAVSPNPTYVDFFYQTDVFEGEPKIMEPDKCDAMEWYPMDALPENTLDFVKHVIENHRERRLVPFREGHA